MDTHKKVLIADANTAEKWHIDIFTLEAMNLHVELRKQPSPGTYTFFNNR